MSALNLSEIVATTLRNRNPKLADNITNDNWLLSTLKEKGNIKKAMGGRTLVEPLMYAENSSAKWYDGYETFDISEQDDQIDAAEYDWKQIGGFAMISGIEAIKNSGKYAALNLIKSRIKVLESTLHNRAAEGVYADGVSDPKAFGGLQLLIQDDPTAASVVGGIDQAANAFWRNQADTTGGPLGSANVTGRMNAMWLACRRGKDYTDLIVGDYVAYTAYEESLQQQQRFTNESKKAAAGFEALKYKQADVIADEQVPASPGTGTGGRFYFVNSDYLYLQCHPSREFTVGETRKVENADYDVVPVWFAGNLTCSNRARQGVLAGTSA